MYYYLFIANPFDLMKQDQHWLPGLDGSRWLYYVTCKYVFLSVCVHVYVCVDIKLLLFCSNMYMN